MKIFCSGSCRLFVGIGYGTIDVAPIHSMIHNLTGPNFLGKQHNTKQHIQFLKYINGDIEIPKEILVKCFTAHKRNHKYLEKKRINIKQQFNECDWFIFEICSIKIYTNSGFYVFNELTNDYVIESQTADDLYNDLMILRNSIPEDKNILFQCHFRPNIIYNDESKSIESREIIYKTIKQFCDNNKNTYIYDPSVIINENINIYDGDVHFHPEGHALNFKYICENYLFKI
jgi:hypothetical protein